MQIQTTDISTSYNSKILIKSIPTSLHSISTEGFVLPKGPIKTAVIIRKSLVYPFVIIEKVYSLIIRFILGKTY